MRRWCYIFLLVMLTCAEKADAQVALGTNLLYDATLSPNISARVQVDSTWAVGLLAGINAWDIDKAKNKKWRHLLLAPHVRKYTKLKYDVDSLHLRKANYIEANVIYSHFNVGNTKIPFGLYPAVKDRRLQGDLVALGAKYGCAWTLGHDWWIEAEAGVAVGYAWFKEYDCNVCGDYHGRDCRFFVLPQVGINVVYLIYSSKRHQRNSNDSYRQ